ncbi:TonB-dependent receptor domain-containing protein [Hyphomonas oceanitis]|uniref:TonB-dependent receptor n=1 Tax=Hyphomonas oceanitis SCH89 TaxID=1280953 RepID=A0A059G8Y0_9PROT|nr:TonB-dependent receptor [Hyphomonas oceanitis]KDA02898.1 TonB-dependent receptor [Hyphomonas oceanitis SCH89]
MRVTGSRLSSEYTSVAPIQILRTDEAALEGISDVGSLLQTATVAAGSPQVTAASSSAFVQNGGVGTETVSLRGLGANRTLVLINGRRAGPAGTRGAVSAFDLNAIPLSAVESVEILKDGASSVYGSDAVAGVVNIITKKDDGLDLDFFVSAPENSGGEQLQGSATWGKTFERGHAMLSFDYYKQEELARGDRDYYKCGEDYYFNSDGSRADVIDPRTGNARCNDLAWGHIWVYDYNSPSQVTSPWQGRPQLIQYDYDGDLGNYLPGFPVNNTAGLVVPGGFYAVGYDELLLPGATPDPVFGPSARDSLGLVNADSVFQDEESLSPEVERITLYGTGEFEVSSHMDVYGEFLMNRRETYVNGYRQFWTYDYVYDYGGTPISNSPSALANGWGSVAGSGAFVGLSPTAITDHNDTKITVDYINTVAGVRGNFDAALSDWNYNAYLQFSRSDGDYQQDLIYDDAITPYQWFNGNTCAGSVTPVRGVNCVDVNWYDPETLRGNVSDQDREFMFGSETGNTVYEQTQFEMFFDGPLFELPAGTVGAGFGANRLRERINDIPGEVTRDGNAWGSSSAGITKGAKNTSSIFGELAIPLIKDAPLMEALDLSLSARWTSEETNVRDQQAGQDNTTYKAGLGWQVVPSVKLRATYGTSFRGAELFEAALAGQTAFAGQRSIDPCVNYVDAYDNGTISQRRFDNCAADLPAGLVPTGGGGSATVSSTGNPFLAPETSEAMNIGIIWAPTWINFRATLDYFEIEIKDEITRLGAANILLGCYDSESFATEPLCGQFTRDPNNYLIDTVTNDFINVATQTNTGFDFNAEYSRDFSFGTLTLNTQHTYQIDDEIVLFSTSEPLDTTGEAGEPEWVGNLNVTLDRGPWSYFWGMDFIGATSNLDSYIEDNGDAWPNYLGQPVGLKLKTEQVTYHSVSVGRELPNGFEVRVGVRNVFDEHPPALSAVSSEYDRVGTSAFYSQYDAIGRRFFLNVSKSF